MAWLKQYLDNVAAMQQINPQRLNAVVNAYSYEDIFTILDKYGQSMLGILVVMAEYSLPIDFAKQVTPSDGNCFMLGLQNQTIENMSVIPKLTQDQIVELNMDKQQLRNLWCQKGKDYFAGKWGSKVNYKGNMPDEEWETDWKKQSQNGVYDGTFLASDLFIMVPPHRLKRHILVIDSNLVPPIKLLDANFIHNNDVPDLNPFILAHTHNHYQSMIPLPGSEEFWRNIVNQEATKNRNSAIPSLIQNNESDIIQFQVI